MNKILLSILSVFMLATAIAGEAGKDKGKKPKKPKLEDGMYVEFTTNKGVILCQLEYQKTPMTVANFVGLAEGNLKVDSFSYSKPYYDGLKFHRVINDFMIQGGDPLGNGMGGPDHRFWDETREDLQHSGPGILSMANADQWKEPYSNTGRTNGSQFFITHKATPHLDGKHTVFGHVIAGQDVVNAIVQGDTMITVKIIRKGKDAKKWNATEHFAAVYDPLVAAEKAKLERYERLSKMTQAEYKEEMFNEVKAKYPSAQQSSTGLVYIIENPGADYKPEKGSPMSVHYRGTLRLDGSQFDASYDRGAPMDFLYLTNRMIPGFEEGLSMLGKGGKAKLIIPYYSAYGSKGSGPIAPYSDLVFDIEIVDLQAPSEEPAHDHDHNDHDGHQH